MIKVSKIDHETLSYNHGLYQANLLMQIFYYNDNDYSFLDVWEDNKEDILNTVPLNKPSKWTLLHYWIDTSFHVEDDIKEIFKFTAGSKEYFEMLKDYLIDTGLLPNLEEPNFGDSCDQEDQCYDSTCKCWKLISAWEDHFLMNADNVKKSIVHATFQIMFNNRRFMHDFNVMVAKLIEKDIDFIIEKKPEYISLKKKRVKRATYWPIWLKQALLYRDKGTCVLCRKDVTSQYHIASDLEIDHIVPLDLYGTNDSTNFQLLCKSCNASKQAGSTSTNLINVPFWNI